MKRDITMNNEQLTGNNEQRKGIREWGIGKREKGVDSPIPTICSLLPILCSCFLFVLFSCENPIEMPFKAGLGPVEDTRPPTVSLAYPRAKDKWIFGNQRFSGSAEDDYKLSRLEMWVEEHAGFRDNVPEDRKRWTSYQPVEMSISPQNKGTFSFYFDTTVYRDGRMNIRLKVWDSYNKSSVTDAIALFVKNEPTAITLTSPFILRGDDEGQVGGDTMNTPLPLPDGGLNYRHKVPKNQSISGTIGHDQGIYRAAEGGGNYPPQIRLWRIRAKSSDPTGPGWYAPDVLPGAEVGWKPLDLSAMPNNTYMFNYYFPDGYDPGYYYGFEIRAQNIDGRSRFNYPRGYYDDDTDWTVSPGSYNSHVIVYYSPDSETPVVERYDLEDVNAYWNSSGGSYPYPTLPVGEDHPYVDKPSVDKKGEFILRIRARHSEGIGAAEVYWENPNATDPAKKRGRFIWDFMPDTTYAGMPNQTISDNQWDLDPSKPYNQWGYKEPYAPYLSLGRLSRSFFFHYRHDKNYRIPAGASASGRAQVQYIICSDQDWADGKKAGSWIDDAGWQNMTDVLPDGTYTLEVYARTPSLGPMESPLKLTLRLDTKEPTVKCDKIFKVEEKSDFAPGDNGLYTVNGVIQPSMTFNDPAAPDASRGSNRRYANVSYFPGTNAFEQFFVVVDQTGKDALDGKITGNKYWWPITAATTASDTALDGVAVYAHGPVSEKTFKVKTTPMYTFPPAYPPVGTDADSLPNGGNDNNSKYWVYIFCRDNAFNVGKTSIALNVDWKGDIPSLDYDSGAIKDITDPNAYNTTKSFVYINSEGKEAYRNKLATGSSIQVLIKDDDSLDLGDSATNSGVTVTFAKSKLKTPATNADIEPDPATAVPLLTIKDAFAPPDGIGSGRAAVTSRMGKITQNMLIEAINAASKGTLYGVNADTTSLPDGTYKVTIHIPDYKVLKMVKDSASVAETAYVDEEFWVAVDNNGPVPTRTPKADDPLSAQPDDYITADYPQSIRGTVEDANGPVTITEWKVYDNSGNVVRSDGALYEGTKRYINFNASIPNGPASTDPVIWKNEFTTTVNMGTQSGKFKFEIKFKDRFGNTSTLSQFLQVDNEKPTADIGDKIATFIRAYNDADTGLSGVSMANRERLANGVLNFSIDARDNVRIQEAKWWLVEGDNPIVPTESDYKGDTTYAGTVVRSGTLDSTNYFKPRYINPAESPIITDNTAYTLFVMAKDSAGNISTVGANSRQTIYLMQAHDAPYFYPDTSQGGKLIVPNDDGAVVGTAIVSGEIEDDDGFFAVSGTTPLSGSVKIWMAKAEDYNPSGLVVSDESTFASHGFTSSVTYGTAPFTGGLSFARTKDGNSVINVSVNLKDMFGSASGPMSSDGKKYYIIQAKDSYSEKWAYTDVTQAVKPSATTDRKTRNKLCVFVYDTKDPVITLSNPDKTKGTKTYGPNASDDSPQYQDDNFRIKGRISDANLKKITDPSDNNDYYYFEYALASGNKKVFILNTAKPGITATYNGGSPPTVDPYVDFEVSASVFYAALNALENPYSGLASDTEITLTLTATDQGDRKGTYSFTFKKDEEEPVPAITVPLNAKRLPRLTFNGGVREWWYTPNATEAQDWYKAQRFSAEGDALPRIDYNSPGVPQLKVTFTDATSAVKISTLQYWIDNESTARTIADVIDPPTADSKNVSFTIPLTQFGNPTIPLADGVHSIRFSIEDVVGNVIKLTGAEKSPSSFTDSARYGGTRYWGFRINSLLPVITVEPPTASNVFAGTASNVFALKVIAAGANLQKAQLRVKDPNGSYSYPWTDITLAANNANWGYDVNNDKLETLTWAAYNVTRAMLGSVANGDYELEVVAVGMDGKSSEPFLWKFTIDALPPDTLQINGFPATAILADSDAVAPSRWSGDQDKVRVFTSPSNRIQGLIKDEHSNLKNAQILIQRYDYATGAWGDYYARTSQTTGAWGGDSSGNGTGTWNELLGSGESTREKLVNIILGDIVNIADGLYRVRLRAKDSSYKNGDSTWPKPNDSSIDGHPTYSSYYYFFYATAKPAISFDNADKTLFSAAILGGKIQFKGTAASGSPTAIGGIMPGNSYKNITATIQRTGASGLLTPEQIFTAGMPTTNAAWDWTAELSGFTGDSGGDGSYKLTFTITDWAGLNSSLSRTITVDNTPPTGNFTAPGLLTSEVGKTVDGNKIYEFASETFYGGQEAQIRGTASDTNGLAGIWFHLGYTDNVAPQGNVKSPRKEDVIKTVLGVEVDKGGDENNLKFDAAAQYKGADSHAWFKYDTDFSLYPRPDLNGSAGSTNGDFFEYPSAADLLLYDWQLTVLNTKDLKNYTVDGITVKGRTYNGTGNRTMAHRVNESGLDLKYQKNGLYSIPIWIRVADEAGNVHYYNRDIWVYPNGDYPTNAIENPKEKYTSQGNNNTTAMGGTILINGIASDNVNVKSVLYRVRADNVSSRVGAATYNARWNDPTYLPYSTQVIYPTSGATAYSGTVGDQVAQDVVFRGNSSYGQSTNVIDFTGWHVATLEDGDVIRMGKSWSFYLNANNEFTTESQKDATGKSVINPIRDWGFRNATTGANDTVRVIVEILVFDGGGADGNAFHFMSLGDNTASLNAAPDVRIFYLTSTAPEISGQQISKVDADTASGAPQETNTVEPYEAYASGMTRGSRFAVRMKLDSGGGNIKRVSVSLPEEGRGGGHPNLALYRDAWLSGNGGQNLPGVRFATNTTATLSATHTAAQTFYLYYAFDTGITKSDYDAKDGAAFAPVMKGSWAESGGKYTIAVRLYDQQDKVTNFTFEIGIDNFAPLEDRAVISNSKVAGSNQTFMGRIYDYHGPTTSPSPPYFSVNRVYAWFTKNDGTGRYIDMTGGSPMATVATDDIQAYVGRTAGFDYNGTSDEVATITYDNTDSDQKGTRDKRSYPTDPKFVKVINAANAADSANKMIWQPIGNAGNAILWNFTIDTTKLPDGPVCLNYIVVDGAGNASLYRQDMVVMNNYPEITGVTLYTDNNGQGAAYTKEASADYPVSGPEVGFLDTDFISKNSYIGFKVTTIKGNDSLNYRLQYVEREGPITLTRANLALIAIDANTPGGGTYSNIYTIDPNEGMGDMGAAVWAEQLMDVPADTVNVANGMSFAFKAAADAFDDPKLPDYTAKVYRYKPVSGLEKTVLNVPVGDPTVVDDGAPGNPGLGVFNFKDSAFGNGANQIHETLGTANTAYFLIKVWDKVNGNSGATEDDQLYKALVVGMNVYLTDKGQPTARLYDLNPYTEAAVTGNNITTANQAATVRNAANPRGIGRNIVRGGLYNTGTTRDVVKSGFIDPRGQSKALTPQVWNSETGQWDDADGYTQVAGDAVPASPNTDLDKVSGTIILRGVAWDDQLIDEVRIKIGASGTEKAILKLNASGKMDVETTTTPANNGRVFFVEDLHWKTGHTVEWAYVWDTHQEGGLNGAPGNVTVQTSVKDKKNTTNGTSASYLVSDEGYAALSVKPELSKLHNQVTVSVVPYITGFERAAQFTTKRSLQGWYSFYQGETVTVKGYNFGTGTVSVSVNGGTGITAAGSSTSRNFTIPATGSASGAITMTVGGSTAAYNNTSTIVNKSWNREYSVNTNGSDLWINRPYAHIWRTAQEEGTPGASGTAGTIFAAIGSTAGLDNPSMALQYTGASHGRLHAVWAIFGRDSYFYGQNHSDGTQVRGSNPYTNANYNYGQYGFGLSGAFLLQRSGEPYLPVAMDYYNAPNATADNHINSVSAAAVYQRDGEPRILLKPRVHAYVAHNDNGAYDGGGTDGNVNGQGDNDGFAIGNVTSPTSTTRWKSLRIRKAAVSTADNNPGKVFVTAYDSDPANKRLFFTTQNATLTTYNGAGEANASNRGYTFYLDGTNASNGIGGIGAANAAGRYNAVDFDSAGRPVVAYFDEQHQTLRLAYANGNAPNAANSWTRRYVLSETNDKELYLGSGSYVSMKIQRANDSGTGTAAQGDADLIHLAFYNSDKKTLVYAVGTRTGTFTAYAIDRVVEGGQWTDISVDTNNNPWIVYADSSRLGNRDGARIAYKSSGTGAFTRVLNDKVTGASITGWEAITMPADYDVKDDRLNIAVWPPKGYAGAATSSPIGGWHAAVGYASDQFRIGYFFKPTSAMGGF